MRSFTLNGSSDEYGIKDTATCVDKSIICKELDTHSILQTEDEFLVVFGTKNGYIFIYDM